MATSSCSGNCPAGYICLIGTGDSTTFNDCGTNVFCLAGTSSTSGRKTPQSGYYASPGECFFFSLSPSLSLSVCLSLSVSLSVSLSPLIHSASDILLSSSSFSCRLLLLSFFSPPSLLSLPFPLLTETSNGAIQVICPKGFYCINGLKTRCPKGTYGNALGVSSISCSGLCRKGYHCPIGSISATQEPCAPDGDSQPQTWFCPVGIGRVKVDAGKITGPTTVSNNHREYQENCPANAVCTNGDSTRVMEWTGIFTACNANAVSSSLFGWTSSTVTQATIPEATLPTSATLPLTAVLASSLTGSISYKFHKCPTCCTGQQCVGNCANKNIPGAPFELNSGSILRPTSSTILDYETCSSPYYYQISATTSASGVSSSIYCQVAISVQDINEAPIVTAGQERSVIEESIKGTEVGLPIVAIDPEVAAGTQGLNWRITTCLPSPGGVCAFRIRSCSGQVVVDDASLIDYDVMSSSNYQFTLQVVAKDDGDPNQVSESSPTTILINIVNRNDAPVIAAQTFNANENVNVAEAGCTYTLDPCVCQMRCPTGLERFGDGSA